MSVKQAVRWMPMDKWDACAFKVTEESLRGRVCYGGLDLSPTTDITAFVLVFPPLDEDDKYVAPRIYGYRKIRWSFECAVTMFHTMSGRSKASCRPPKEMCSTTATSRNSSSSRAKSSISVKSPLTAVA